MHGFFMSRWNRCGLCSGRLCVATAGHPFDKQGRCYKKPAHCSPVWLGQVPSPFSANATCGSDLAFRRVVTTIMVMSETLPLANVKSKFSEMVDRVEHTHDRIIVTRNGRPAAVLISPEELESLEDTLELLSDPEAMRELAESRKANESGDFIDGDELRRRFLAK